MKKLNLVLVTLLSITSIFAEYGAADVTKDYVRAAFWTFTLIISVGGLLLIVKKRNEVENPNDNQKLFEK